MCIKVLEVLGITFQNSALPNIECHSSNAPRAVHQILHLRKSAYEGKYGNMSHCVYGKGILRIGDIYYAPLR